MPAAGGIFGRGRAGDVSGRYAGGRTAIPRLRACGAALGMTWLLDSLPRARNDTRLSRLCASGAFSSVARPPSPAVASRQSPNSL